jgi:glycosyltransferase involved in cell wall biosynthesis
VTGPGTAAPAGLRVSYLLGTTAGGTGRHVAMLAGGCAARGATVHVYGPASAGAGLSRPGAAQPGWDFSVVSITDRPRPGRDLAAVLRVRRLVIRDTPDVLHAHGLRAGALAALALAGPGTPWTMLAVTVHNAPPAAGPAAAVYAGLELIVARRADAVLTVSGDLAARMRRRGARLAGRALVPAPAAPVASPAEIAALRHEFEGRESGSHESGGRESGSHESGDRESESRESGVREFADPQTGDREFADGPSGDRESGDREPGGPQIVLGVGRLATQKGFGTLIRAAAWWQRRSVVPLVIIAGDGPLDAELRQQAGTAGVAVRFLGLRRDVPALLGAADVVVVPSSWEGQPLIVQEALRAGRPLVATRVGGIADLTGDDGAVLVPPGDPVALATAVARILDDPEAAARLAAAARARAALLPTEAAAVDQALAVYEAMTTRP